MAECFEGVFRSLHVSRGASRALLEALLAAAEQDISSNETLELAAFLRSRLDRDGGACAFPIKTPNDADEPERLVAFLKVCERCARRFLAADFASDRERRNPDFENIAADDALRDWYAACAAFLAGMTHEALGSQRSSRDDQLAALLAPRHIAVKRILRDLEWRDARRSDDARAKLRLLAEILDLADCKQGDALCIQHLETMASLRREIGDRAGERAAYERLASLLDDTKDRAYRQAIETYIDDLNA
jgi:hypothetical protein